MGWGGVGMMTLLAHEHIFDATEVLSFLAHEHIFDEQVHANKKDSLVKQSKRKFFVPGGDNRAESRL